MGFISFSRSAIPPGIKLVRRIGRNDSSFKAYRASVLILTFIAYALYHASRKPLSVVKNVLQSDDALNSLPILGATVSPLWPLKQVSVGGLHRIRSNVVPMRGFTSSVVNIDTISSNNDTTLEGLEILQAWAPFDTDSATVLLGEVDLAFLASYAIGMFFAGHLGERLCNRWFITVGMIGSGICVALFGMAYWWNVHWLGYFFLVQIIAGLFQATGWPSVVTVVARWFGKRKRGLIMGIWNAHTSVGNILGSLIASAMLNYGWGWSFVVPGIAIAAGGVLIFLFLVVDPVIVGLPSPYQKTQSENKARQIQNGKFYGDGENGAAEVDVKMMTDPQGGFLQDEKSQPFLSDSILGNDAEGKQEKAVGFFQAWTIPGVAMFAFCLFFTKLVLYTFLYWLPFYIRNTEIQGEYLSDTTSGNLSTLFDVGGIFGGILAGYISDKITARAVTAASFMYAAIAALLLYYIYGSVSLWLNIFLLFVAGIFVNGPYALITTAVSADLGTHESLKGNSKALATVTAIIDGTGSVGAAVGPLLTGYLSEIGWNSVFSMLMLSALFSGLLLTKLVIEEVQGLINRVNSSSTSETMTQANV